MCFVLVIISVMSKPEVESWFGFQGLGLAVSVSRFRAGVELTA